MMPTPTLFIVFSFLLRAVEGIGTAMYTTVSYTVLTQLYPEKKGTVVVSALPMKSSAFLLHSTMFAMQGLIQLALAAGYATGPAVAGGFQEVHTLKRIEAKIEESEKAGVVTQYRFNKFIDKTTYMTD